MRHFLKALVFVALLGAVAIAAAVFTVRALHRKPHTAPAPIPDTKITLIEGWTNSDMAAYLDKQGVVDKSDFLAAADQFNAADYPLLADKPSKAGLEGFLFPDTYLISKRPSSTPTDIADEIITKQLDNFSQKFTPAMQQQALARHISVYDVVTLASIVERETGREALSATAQQSLLDERKIIAGIFYNRLQAGMPLQSDATINYITGKSDAQASTADTQIKSPYNTYLNVGLTPGPICNPSLSSLTAVLYPTTTNYFYFLHRQDTGAPVYAVTYEEHLQNKAKYLK